MEKHLNRRRFLGASLGTGAAAATAGAWAPSALAKGQPAAPDSEQVPKKRIAIQLYTLRRIMTDGPSAGRVLKQLAELGYSEVELAGYYGLSAAEFRKLVDAAGLRAVSGHDPLNIDPASTTWKTEYQQTLENAKTMGQSFTGLAWQPGPHTEERYKQLAQRMNEAGALAKAAGLQFFYHNHNFEFENKRADGKPLYDTLHEETDPDLVKFELDLYWIIVGGENPLAYLSAEPRRYIGYHVKDKTWKDRPNANDFEDVGPGSIDFPDIFRAGDEGDKHYIVEHDEPWLSHPDDPEAELKTALAGVQYLRSVRF